MPTANLPGITAGPGFDLSFLQPPQQGPGNPGQIRTGPSTGIPMGNIPGLGGPYGNYPGYGLASPLPLMPDFTQGGQAGVAQQIRNVNSFNNQWDRATTPMAGPPIPPEYLLPTGPVEDQLMRLYLGGPQGLQTPMGPQENYLGSLQRNMALYRAPGTDQIGQLAQGQIPHNIMRQYQQRMRENTAGVLESMGGARYGSDAMGAVAREQSRGLTDLAAEAQRNMLGAQGQLQNQALARQQGAAGVGNMLLGSEGQRYNNALNRYFSIMDQLMGAERGRISSGFQFMADEFRRQQGIPVELQTLMGITGLAPGGQSISSTPPPSLGAAAIGAGQGLLQSLPYLIQQFQGGNQAQPTQPGPWASGYVF